MVSAVYSIYHMILQCLPKGYYRDAPLVFHWDGYSMARYLQVDFEIERGFSPSEALAYADQEDKSIHTIVTLSWKPIAVIVFVLLHEIAHLSGYDKEIEADEQAYILFKKLMRSKKWQKTGIKLSLVHKPGKNATYLDRITSDPVRLSKYEVPWEEIE